MLINNSVTVLSSVFIGYYKAVELYTERKEELNYDELLLEYKPVSEEVLVENEDSAEVSLS
jgi:hypothetical protein